MRLYAILAAITLGCALPAQAEKLVLAHGYAPSHNVLVHGIVPWMACVRDGTQNAYDFDHFPSGQISGHTQSVSSLNSGLADLSVIVVAYSSDKVPMNGIPLLPGMGTTSVEMVGAYRRALSQDGILAGEYAAIDTVPLLVSILPAYQVFSTIGPIDTLEKFAGFKVRVSGGSPTFMAQSLGAIPIEINATDMYIALQRKTVDGTFLTMSSAKPYAIHELVNAVSTNGSFGSGSSVLAMDRGKFEALPPEHRQVFVDCGLEAEMATAEYVDAENAAVQAEFVTLGIDAFAYPDDVLEVLAARMSQVTSEYIGRLTDRGLPAAEALQEYQNARAD
ncbi:TRAP transporter substrate-binding protein [Paracoccus denitrificans]|jgi:TRAP-type C4-dicarboxylate transport system substrate-binding protein|uniref:TRAP dicarboxylate transporter-DctP subunit n=1 Tax=Paracoccus denitrificans (strain Pd 1222) TaxID=318586 RepID=A1B743_PARDP|nr:C4-dicarboxylate ABC transporter substrate-binding protein [Paracoccus denitrificans]ABL71337.1 TRAP dicarboxylate transporter- DctP subunit [Paracoccus denitrificans PD1222]MBB4629959.1 TRAP-type C4-dicarboxylate transport system substrate-binding protein [Paracoccus denitrificans]MCU7431312.1 C4-dicarboxylate ABC transporter substrate-binding protein [Paracoccus denitrificans]QAR27965.1 C4-dicarboxylate ABC transporter substrate-binding protein [Paracoccus denitrificans]UPV97681.1 C4-dica